MFLCFVFVIMYVFLVPIHCVLFQPALRVKSNRKKTPQKKNTKRKLMMFCHFSFMCFTSLAASPAQSKSHSWDGIWCLLSNQVRSRLFFSPLSRALSLCVCGLFSCQLDAPVLRALQLLSARSASSASSCRTVRTLLGQHDTFVGVCETISANQVRCCLKYSIPGASLTRLFGDWSGGKKSVPCKKNKKTKNFERQVGHATGNSELRNFT